MNMRTDAVKKELGSNALAARWEELQATSERLASQGRRFLEYFELAPEAFLVTDCNTMICAANHAAAGLLGLPRLMRKPITVFVEIGQRSAFRTQFNHVVAGRMAATQWQSVLRPPAAGPVPMKVRVRSIDHGAGVPRDYFWVLEPLD
jgi:PAS domain-containing protein